MAANDVLFNQAEIALLARLKTGDIASYEELYRKYYATFRVFIKGMIKDETTAEDIVQNIFMKVWINRAKLNETLSIKNYLYVLAKHEVLNHLRSKHSSLLRLKEAFAENVPDKDNTDERYNLTEMQSIVDNVIQQMPDKRRQIFKMSRDEYLSNKDIAHQLGLSVRTVDKHIELALKDIRKQVTPFCFFLFMIFLS
jgi:RNA polymerase sigma-70 factor (ECF subfamily)